MTEREPRRAPSGRTRGPAAGRSGRPDRGGRRHEEDSARRRRFPTVQITVACDDRDLERLTSRHRVVELRSSAAGPITERTLGFLVDRTRDGFRVDVRAHRLLTLHPTPSESLWPDVRDRLPGGLRAKPQLFPDELPASLLDAALDRFVAQIKPLHEFDKLGAIVFQFPSYFSPGPRALDYLAWLRDRCGDLALAVELRRRDWVDTKHRDDTLAFLAEQRLSYVCADAPQGTDTAVPPVAASTTDLAIVRMHGRHLDAWERDVDDPLARMRYEYRRPDLEPWIPRLEKLASGGRQVHVIMTTAPPDAATRGASLLVKTLTDPPGTAPSDPPRRNPARRRR